MITISGQRIEPLSKFGGKYNGIPNIIDIALGLSNQTRFAGQTRRWWSVLLHSIVCAELAQFKTNDRRLVMLCLLHDAHEAVTADVPAFWKPKELKEWQNELDERLFTSLNLWPISEEDAQFVKEIDDEALRAEALSVGPPTIMQHIALPKNGSYEQALKVAGRFPTLESAIGLGSKAVQEFLDRFADMYRDVCGADVRDDTPSNQPKTIS